MGEVRRLRYLGEDGIWTTRLAPPLRLPRLELLSSRQPSREEQMQGEQRRRQKESQ